MIQFKCICGEPFEVPAELAGDQFQCPVCMRLVDVPMLGDADAYNEDGTIKMDDAAPIESALTAKLRAFSYREDMRQSIEEFLALDQVSPVEEPPKLPPKYDPETGELIEQVEVNSPMIAPIRAIPIAKPTLQYARKDVRERESDLKWWQLPFLLLLHGSGASMLMILIVHILCHFILLIPGFGFIMSIFILVTQLAILAHYLNVIEEFGPHKNDTVPVMMRNASIGEDIWYPLLRFFYSMFYAFGPMYLAQFLRWKEYPIPEIGIDGLFYFGWCIFPGILLSAVTSGTVLNTLPHRILPVFLASPLRYVICGLLMYAGYILYAVVLGLVPRVSVATLATPSGGVNYLGFFKSTGIFYALCAAAIYVCHLAAAMLGMMYRDYYPKFNWVLQDYLKSTRTDTLSKLEEMRRAGDPRLRRYKKVLPASPQSTPSR